MGMQMMMGGGMGGMGGFGGGKMGGGGGKEEPQKKVRVEGLSGNKWQELKDHMRQAGSVEYVKVANGVGEVRFNTKGEAKKAVNNLNGTILGDAVITVTAWA